MTQGAVNGKRGFVFHDACWSLIKQAFYPDPIPHERLFEVLDSVPMVMAGDSIDWGHDYGGLALLNGEKDYFSWEYYLRFADRQFRDGWSDTPYGANPLASAEATEILAETPQVPPSRDRASIGT
jgi:hypothetical protein